MNKAFCFSPRRDGTFTVTPTGIKVLMKRVGMGNHIVVLSPEDKLGIVDGSPRLRAFDGLSDLPPM